MEKVTFTKEQVQYLIDQSGEDLFDMNGVNQFYLEYCNTNTKGVTEFNICNFEGIAFMKALGKTKCDKVDNKNVLVLDFDELTFDFIPRMSFSEKEIDNMGSGSLKDYSIDYDTDDGYFDAEKGAMMDFSIFLYYKGKLIGETTGGYYTSQTCDFDGGLSFNEYEEPYEISKDEVVEIINSNVLFDSEKYDKLYDMFSKHFN